MMVHSVMKKYGNNYMVVCARCGNPQIVSGGRFGRNTPDYQRPCPDCRETLPSYNQIKEADNESV